MLKSGEPEQSWSLLFPIRYPSNGKIVGLKKVSLDSDTGQIFEENLPREKELHSLQVSEGMIQDFYYRTPSTFFFSFICMFALSFVCEKIYIFF